MTKRRLIRWGSAATALVGGLVLTWPAARHVVRHQIAQHTRVRFGGAVATPIVPEPEAMPAVAAHEPDVRFSSRAMADEGGGRLSSPQLDHQAFAAPVRTDPSTPAAAIQAAAIDQSTEQNPTPLPTDLDFSADLAGAREAILHYRTSDLSAGDDFARLTSGPLRVALDWAAIRLDTRDAGAARLQAFAAAHRDWPMSTWVNRHVEEIKAATHDPSAVLALFATRPPETLTGRLNLARARLAVGDAAGATAIAQAVWRTEDLTPAEESTVLRDFGSLLHRDDHKARCDRLLYRESVGPALRAAALAGPDMVLLARARAAVIAGAASDAAITAVPTALQSDPGLVFARIQKARRAGRVDDAAALLKAAPTDPAAIVDGDAWWVERRLIARKLLDAGNAKLAYAIAAAEAASSPASKIEAEFHAGWIALEFLKDPALAAPHFAAVSHLAETPISNARGAYWEGRAAEAAGQAQQASTFYVQAAELSTTFYGQLAAARLGRSPAGLRQAALPAIGAARNEAVRAAEVLFALGQRDLAVPLAVAIAKTELDPAQVAAMAAVVEGTGDARATLVVGKAGAQRGLSLDAAAFPTFGIPGYQPIDHSADRATVLAIARQESEFDPRSVSSAGAMGLMQLIASTARKTAQDAGIGFVESRLLTDAAFNARIGAAHLGKLLSDLDGSYILTFAAYNAGAGKVKEWIAAYGDPRKPGIDPVDWIERIPFTETRNYVQRVFENMQIYRTQLGMPTVVLTAAQPGPGKGT